MTRQKPPETPNTIATVLKQPLASATQPQWRENSLQAMAHHQHLASEKNSRSTPPPPEQTNMTKEKKYNDKEPSHGTGKECR
ncbi:hypothetical protein ARALYDRAFT_914359 [Arabidopsis lyrata subsp. lyrata]|uniref:Uncharacterized protein n=1 Tax=Arabidopsis lyrata subsp. lyrata TaxID=81972 RepID=D7ME30_ARALL|nr:hypothetical protein ARALYDRAFT_914359 [Arabidopsis lyrata subsp. lyrata]